MTSPSAATYRACQDFFDEITAQGVRHAVISPGSRSTALALSADNAAGLETWVRIDERSAAFFALGIAKASGVPTVLICTSGTAAANYLPAVVEASYSGVPLLVLTADRPAELRDWGAGQTIDQRHLYGTHVRWFFEAPIADELAEDDLAAKMSQRWWRALGARAVSQTIGASPGPVHINWPFREPLEPPADWFTDANKDALGDAAPGDTANSVGASANVDARDNAGSSDNGNTGVVQPGQQQMSSSQLNINQMDIAELVALAQRHPHGVVVAGPMNCGPNPNAARKTSSTSNPSNAGNSNDTSNAGNSDPTTSELGRAVARFCAAAGWPLLAEPTSQLRQLHQPQLDQASTTAHPHATVNAPAVVSHFDLILAALLAPPLVKKQGIEAWNAQRPVTAVVRIGDAPVSKPLRLWLERHQPEHLLISPAGSWTDASFTSKTTISADPARLLDAAATQLEQQSSPKPAQWPRLWEEFDTKANQAINKHVELSGADSLTHPSVVHTLSKSLPAGHTLFASNSLPVRAINSYLQARSEPLTVLANRGASGIDGVISTAAGVAAAGHPTTVMLGDLAFRHDLGGLAALAETSRPSAPMNQRSAPMGQHSSLTVLVLDNGGGKIFDTLPVASTISADTFQRLFTTPTCPDSRTIATGLASTFGFAHHHACSTNQLSDLLANPATGVRLITVAIDAAADSTQQQRIVTRAAKSINKVAARAVGS